MTVVSAARSAAPLVVAVSLRFWSQIWKVLLILSQAKSWNPQYHDGYRRTTIALPLEKPSTLTGY